MDMVSAKVVQAVNLLIEAPNYASLVGEITGIVERWDTHPMVYGGSLSCLNALVDVGLQDRDAFGRLLKLVDEKRKLHPHVRRADYQRELMRERRARQAKALELHELQFGLLRGAARMEEIQRVQDRWAKAKQEFLRGKGDLDWKGRNEATGEFWAQIDANLDKNLADARRKRKVAYA